MNFNKIVGKLRDGSFYVKGSSYFSEYELTQKALERLYAYEEIGLSPKEIENLISDQELNNRVIRKLASGEIKKLKDLEQIVERTAPKEE